jgi:predicted nucleic acid-binding protein
VIFIYSNVPMYLVGVDYPHKWDARRMLERLVSERQRLVTDAEVLQEILHR